MGQATEISISTIFGFEFAQALETLIPGEEIMVKYCGTVEILTNEQGEEIECLVQTAFLDTICGYRMLKLPVDQYSCSSDWQKALSKMRTEAREKGWQITPEMQKQFKAKHRISVHSDYLHQAGII